jgi:putative phosphoesterase
MRRSVAGFRATREGQAPCNHPGMRIAAVSDTHLPKFGRALPRALVEGVRTARVDLIVHLGDFIEPFVPGLFEALAPFDGVAGNNDGPELGARFGRSKVLELEGVRVGLTHGDLGLASRTSAERARTTFVSDGVGLVLFGHSHAPLVERVPGGPLLVNPGSPTDKRAQPRYSWALVEITGGEVRAELRFFDDRSP